MKRAVVVPPPFFFFPFLFFWTVMTPTLKGGAIGSKGPNWSCVVSLFFPNGEVDPAETEHGVGGHRWGHFFPLFFPSGAGVGGGRKGNRSAGVDEVKRFSSSFLFSLFSLAAWRGRGEVDGEGAEREVVDVQPLQVVLFSP